MVDVSQSVEPIHPMGWEFLLRDCINVQKVIIINLTRGTKFLYKNWEFILFFKFFSNRKLENVKSGEEIFNEVTNMNFDGEGAYFLSQVKFV